MKNTNAMLLSNARSSLSGEDLLQSPSIQPDAKLLEEEQIQDQEDITHVFPTGHRITLNINGQSIQVEDIHGKLQVEIDITEQGPQIRLNGGQLDLQSPENIGFDCHSFRVHTEGNTEIFAKGQIKIDSRDEMKITCDQDVYVRGKVLWLN